MISLDSPHELGPDHDRALEFEPGCDLLTRKPGMHLKKTWSERPKQNEERSLRSADIYFVIHAAYTAILSL
jgi:hypothetical protein